MTPKFKIGDILVSVGGNPIVIDYIMIYEKEIRYYDKIGNFARENETSIYTEPKPKVKKWFYLVKYKNDPESITTTPYKNDEEAKHDFLDAQWIQRLDWSMVEVPDNE